MDEKQIKKKIEKKINKWDGITFFTLFLLLIIIPFILNGMISITIGLYVIFILGFIALTAFIAFSTYVYDFVEKRYDEFIEREEYWQKQTLKEKILDIITFIWFISPFFIIISIPIMIAFPMSGIIIGFSFSIFWLFGLFILNKNKK